MNTKTTRELVDLGPDRPAFAHMCEVARDGTPTVAWCGAIVPRWYLPSGPGDEVCVVCADLMAEAGLRVEDYL